MEYDIKFFGEYGCPKGKWSMSKRIKTKFRMEYNKQRIFDLVLPVVDCLKEMALLEICEDCPVNGKITTKFISIWDYGKLNVQEARIIK